MTSHLATGFGLAVVILVLVAVLKAVERREKFLFVPGVVLILAGPGLVVLAGLPEAGGGVVALVGVLAILASVVPLLRQSPATA